MGNWGEVSLFPKSQLSDLHVDDFKIGLYKNKRNKEISQPAREKIKTRQNKESSMHICACKRNERRSRCSRNFLLSHHSETLQAFIPLRFIDTN